MTNIVLHQWEFSPFCTKIRKVLDYKGINYSCVNYNGLQSLKARTLSKAGKLPVLEVNGQFIQDSRLIIAHLEQEFPEKSIIPKDKNIRAKAEILQDWADESIYFYEICLRVMYPDAMKKVIDLATGGRPFYEKYIIGPGLKYQLKQVVKQQGTARYSREQVENRFLHLMAQIDQLLSESHWLAGDDISIADFAMAGQLLEVLRTSHLKETLLAKPNLGRWLKEMR